MPPEQKTLGTAIDEVVSALEPLDDAARLTAIRAACDHLDIHFWSQPPPQSVDMPALGVSATSTGVAPPPAATASDIRTFKEQKNPGSATEMACVVAYYLQHLAPAGERQPEISAADIEKYFVQANFPLPKRSDQLLVNAKAAGYFDSPARGAYRLNAVGHNLVAHSLPRDRVSAAAPSPQRKRTAKKRAAARPIKKRREAGSPKKRA
jgi:hypothetical protein